MKGEGRLTADALLEALLFVAQEPVAEAELFSVVGLSPEEGQAALEALERRLAESGLSLQRMNGRVQLTTRPAAAPYVEAFLDLEVNLTLSQAAMETLAIVAYAQPVTRPEVEAIRGVGSGSVLRTLLSAGLIEKAGRADSVGRPILYRTSFEFLEQFGLESVEDLPSLEPPQQEADAASIDA
ncbi:MAG: SMC-Scp complex subunit ScpB [Anaerolineae bacterium]